jgi:hypothetical protein
MSFFRLILLAAGVVIGALVITKIGGWLIEWAKNVIRSVGVGIKEGFLTLSKNAGDIHAYAIASQNNRCDVVEEITVDETDLSEEILDALRRHRSVSEKIHV